MGHDLEKKKGGNGLVWHNFILPFLKLESKIILSANV